MSSLGTQRSYWSLETKQTTRTTRCNPDILVDTAGAGQENAADGNLQDLTLSCDADRAYLKKQKTKCANASNLPHIALGGGECDGCVEDAFSQRTRARDGRGGRKEKLRRSEVAAL